MKETTKRREKAKESKAEKQKESPQQGAEAQDVEMPEEESAAAARPAKEQDSITLEGFNHTHSFCYTHHRPPGQSQVNDFILRT